ncbi:putative polysaccharide biosynthesis protein [Lachnoclostridium sp.]|nr:polysaccharide biosynthesis protein [Lachnoclostridium sp.]
MSKNTIIKGTLILTFAGLLTRLIGFFYRIFLSKALGAETLGLYQLIFPVYGICFTIYASGIQTAISKLVAEEAAKGSTKSAKRVLKTGVLLSVTIASILSIIIYNSSDLIATKLLLHPESASSLRILAYVFPFCGITACINGYYYGLKKAGVPALTQLVEQIIRVGFVYFAALYFGGGKIKATCELAVVGIVFGEIASNIYNLISLITQKKEHYSSAGVEDQYQSRFLRALFKMSVPLTANRLFISVLHSFEAILIPAMLQKSGLTASEALSLFGILNGMAIPFLLFPSTITNSLSVLLLPAISEASAKQNTKLIAHTVSVSLKYSLILGIFSTGFFLFFGSPLGMSVFHIEEAGTYLVVMAWLCPFLYTATTLSSIINGLGKAHLTFLNSVAGLSLRIILLALIIPKFGIYGYLISVLISQLLTTALDVIIVVKNIPFKFDAVNSLLKPGIITFFGCSVFYRAYLFFKTVLDIPDVALIVLCAFVLTVVTVYLLKATNAIKMGEWKIT